MATFHKRGPYQWQAKIRRKGYPVQSKTFETKDQAEAWARSVEAGMDSGTYRPLGLSQKITVGEMLDRYVREVSVHKAAYRTDRGRVNVIKTFPLASYAIANVTGKELAEFRDARLKEVSPRTVQYDLITIGHAFSVAIKDWGYVLPRGNPIDEVRKPKVGNNARDRRLVGDEEARLLEACDVYGGEIGSIVRFAVETAMRQGEIAAFRWEHVRLSDRTIHLPKEITKTNTDRDVPLSSRAVEILEALPRRIDGRVFGMEGHSIGKAFRRCCGRATNAEGNPAPIKNLRFHDLRHEATSRFFERGLNPMQAASITGHKSLQMLKRYTHLKAEDLAKMLG